MTSFACCCPPDEDNLCSLDEAIAKLLLAESSLASAQVYSYGSASRAQQAGQLEGKIQFPYLILTDLGEVSSEFLSESCLEVLSRLRLDLYSKCPTQGLDLARKAQRALAGQAFEFAFGQGCVWRQRLPAQSSERNAITRTRWEALLATQVSRAAP